MFVAILIALFLALGLYAYLDPRSGDWIEHDGTMRRWRNGRYELRPMTKQEAIDHDDERAW